MDCWVNQNSKNSIVTFSNSLIGNFFRERDSWIFWTQMLWDPSAYWVLYLPDTCRRVEINCWHIHRRGCLFKAMTIISSGNPRPNHSKYHILSKRRECRCSWTHLKTHWDWSGNAPKIATSRVSFLNLFQQIVYASAQHTNPNDNRWIMTDLLYVQMLTCPIRHSQHFLNGHERREFILINTTDILAVLLRKEMGRVRTLGWMWCATKAKVEVSRHRRGIQMNRSAISCYRDKLWAAHHFTIQIKSHRNEQGFRLMVIIQSTGHDHTSSICALIQVHSLDLKLKPVTYSKRQHNRFIN